MKSHKAVAVIVLITAAFLSACGSSGNSSSTKTAIAPPTGNVVATAPTTTGGSGSPGKGRSGSIPGIPAVAAACGTLTPFNHVLAGGSARINGLQAALPAVISQLTGFVSGPAPAKGTLRSEQLRARSVVAGLQLVHAALARYSQSPSSSARKGLEASFAAESTTAKSQNLPECALSS